MLLSLLFKLVFKNRKGKERLLNLMPPKYRLEAEKENSRGWYAIVPVQGAGHGRPSGPVPFELVEN